MNAVSCSSASACMAVGDYWHGSTVHHPLVERWNGVKWTLEQIPRPARAGQQLEMNGVSCSSASSCTAVGSTGPYPGNDGRGHILAVHWNGRRLSLQHTAGSGRGALLGVSCPSNRWCVAVGFRWLGGRSNEKLAEEWNGKTWSLQPTTHFVGDSAVSCTSVRACTAVGGGRASRWDGKEWSHERTPEPQETFLFGVSCSSSSDCVAVGHGSGGSYYFPAIERWTG